MDTTNARIPLACGNIPHSPTTFTLIIDYFGVKYVGKEHADHLIQCIEKDHELTKDWTGNLYCGIQLDWDYNSQTLDISIPGYIKKVLQKIQTLLTIKTATLSLFPI
jgi:hypothetical protein